MRRKSRTKALDSRKLTHDDVPATVGLVKEVREELRAEIRETKHELKAEIEKVFVAVHRTQVLMEEQRAENRIVLDGLKLITERQDRIEGISPNV